MSVIIYLIDIIQKFALPVKFFALQNKKENYFHKDFKFWIHQYFNSKKDYDVKIK